MSQRDEAVCVRTVLNRNHLRSFFLLNCGRQPSHPYFLNITWRPQEKKRVCDKNQMEESRCPGCYREESSGTACRPSGQTPRTVRIITPRRKQLQAFFGRCCWTGWPSSAAVTYIRSVWFLETSPSEIFVISIRYHRKPRACGNISAYTYMKLTQKLLEE